MKVHHDLGSKNVISLLTERVDHTIPIYTDEGKIQTIKNNNG